METCNEGHEMVVYGEGECPVCEKAEEILSLQDKLDEAENEVTTLEDQLAEAEAKGGEKP
jgi:predicted DCC family thiol-disulfide oxidoreductase YuxK